MKEIRAVSPCACVGLGPTSWPAFERALEIEPHFVAADMGSTDPGPYYLGSGKEHFPRFNAKRDLDMMIVASLARGIPTIVGTAGGNGAKPHVDWTIEIVEEIARERGIKFRMALIYSDVDKSLVRKHLKKNAIRSVDGSPPLTEGELDATTYLVAQMGVEPLMAALDTGADLILAGRACDDALFAAVPLKNGYDRGLSLHMGKILECAAVSAVPRFGYSAMTAWLREDHFLVEPADPERICTITSVAAHSLYERSTPLAEAGPGGVVDLTDTVFEQHTDRAVKVSGTRFVPDDQYCLKLEGAKLAGYRSISVVGIRDLVMIASLDEVREKVMGILRNHLSNAGHQEGRDYSICHHVYGKNAIMGRLEPEIRVTSHELGVVTDVIASDQTLAHDICDLATITMFTVGFQGQKSTAGNVAMLTCPWTIDVGPFYTFSVYHLLPVDDPLKLFPIEVVEVG